MHPDDWDDRDDDEPDPDDPRWYALAADDDTGREALTAAERNSSLCRL